jgi:ribosomal protein S18 acetylase RimI-like enzyme
MANMSSSVRAVRRRCSEANAVQVLDNSISMEVSAASPEDCEAVAQVHVAGWQAAYANILDPAFLASLSIERRAESWRRVLAEGKSELLVGRVGSSVVGFASFGPSRDADAPAGRGELWALYLDPQAWSTGVGRTLWLAARERLLSLRFSSVSLWVLERNARAIRFYCAAGFTIEAGSEKEFELGGTKVREVRMVAPLQPH